ncbi:MAG: YerC/YecD family TrpR-related protein [bacterium]|nr:YerC/YecD family TrpR-related protein [bacterium]
MSTRFLSELASAISKIQDKKTAQEFLHNLLTPKELDELGRRLQIVKMLMKGVSQRDIAKKLQVSIGTVSRGSRELQYGAPGFKKVLS